MRIHGPERLGGQGLDAQQEASGAEAILILLTDPAVCDDVDLVLTWRADDEGGAYEAWSRRGLVRFRRFLTDDGTLHFETIERLGEDPLADQRETLLRTVEDEARAAERSGFEGVDPTRRFVRPTEQSYPFAYERIAQLFDSPNAPDLAVSPVDWSQGPYLGNHGALNLRQSRAPLWIKGPRVRTGTVQGAVRSVDLVPTCLAALDFPRIDGADASGRSASERGVAPDVLLRRQDGIVLDAILDLDAAPAERLYVFLLDGLHMTELDAALAEEPERFPNLLRLRDGAATFDHGQIVNFPSITWPSHTAIGTGTWCGHHDVVNPSYYLREKRETVSPQGQQVRTEGFASAAVESVHEAFHRVRGPDCLTAAIHAPFGRSADHAVLEGRNLGDRPRLRALTEELQHDCDPRWRDDGHSSVIEESVLDNRGMAQVIELFERERPPDCVYHELVLTDGVGHAYGPHGEPLRAALAEGDRRIGRVLDLLEARGLAEGTLFVMTADHGMAPQDPGSSENAIRHVERAGVACVVAEPMIWLLDLHLEVQRSADGRTGRVIVSENDAEASGERPPVEGAEVIVEQTRAGGATSELARGHTGPGGVYGFPTPMDLPSDEIFVLVHAEGFNSRRIRIDGTRIIPDLRAALYGPAPRA